MKANELKKRYADGERDFTATDLNGASLNWINLSGANLVRADLYGTQLSGANLSQTNLREANLSYADLSRTDLSQANLEGADLEGANLSNTNLSAAIYNELTKFPQGFDPSKVGMLNSHNLREQAAQTANPPVVLANETSTSSETAENPVVEAPGDRQIYIPEMISVSPPAYTFTPPSQPPLTTTKAEVPILPAASSQSGNLKKTLITSSLIGGAIILGFILTRTPQSSQQVVSSSSPDPNVSQTTSTNYNHQQQFADENTIPAKDSLYGQVEIRNAYWQEVPNTFNTKFGSSAYIDTNGIKKNGNFIVFDIDDPDGDYRQVQGICNANGYRILTIGSWKPKMQVFSQVNDRPDWLNPTEYQKKLLAYACSKENTKKPDWQEVPNTFNTKFGISARIDTNNIKSNGNFIVFDVADPDGDYRQVQGICNVNGYRILIFGSWKPTTKFIPSDNNHYQWLDPTEYQRQLLRFACNAK